MNEYLDLAQRGKNDWWRFLVAFIIIIFLWQGIGSLPSVFLVAWVLWDSNSATGISSSGIFTGVDPILVFTVTMIASLFFMGGLFIAIRFVHQRPFRTLITSARRISLRRVLQGFVVWFTLSGILSLMEAKLHPGRYLWTLDIARFIPFLMLALVMVPIQTSAEELFFRGYLLQGLGLRVRNIYWLSAISGFVFMLPHLLNPEASFNYPLMGFYYFFMGAVMAFLTLRDGRLELALGLHAANNLFSVLIANYRVTVLPSPSIFTVTELDPVFSVITATLALILLVVIFIGPLRRKVTEGVNLEI